MAPRVGLFDAKWQRNSTVWWALNFLDIYQRVPGLTLGFHGCDRRVAESVLSDGKKHLNKSQNEYDWLGGGIYFWESDPLRALEFAKEASQNTKLTKGRIDDPYVVGAVIDLRLCCNLLDRQALGELRASYSLLESLGQPLPTNGESRSTRNLDCLVIENLHLFRSKQGMQGYDSVRGAFWEGGELFPGANIDAKNHVQIAVRNTDCIKGYFRPRIK